MEEQKNELPEILQNWAAKIDATSEPYIKITSKTTPIEIRMQSRLGGHPYWPADQLYPQGSNKLPLYLLAQINFAEVPAYLPFPEQGILQIFIADDPFYGMNDQTPQQQKNFRLVYHRETNKEGIVLLENFSFLQSPKNFPMQTDKTYALEFTLTEAPAPPDHPDFTAELGEDFFGQFGDEKWSILADYRKYAPASGHKMGGYAHFPQEDLRKNGQAPLLLLQLDSDVKSGLNWGDRGTAHFFIDPVDFFEEDFSRVFYEWSSY